MNLKRGSAMTKAPIGGRPDRRGISIVPALAAALVTLAVYLPTLGNGIVNWDDPALILTLNIRHLDLAFIKWAFTSTVLSNWHPLTLISHGIDYAIWGLNPTGHHLTSIVLHGVNTLLVALVSFRLTTRGGVTRLGPGGIMTGLAVALLFGLHPLHVESVAWIAERKDVLSGLFFLLSLLAYLKYASGSSKRYVYGASLVLFALALMSKPMAISLPFVLLIIDYYPLERLSLKDSSITRVLLEKLPFFVLAVASGVVTLLAQSGAIKSLEVVALTERVAVAVRGYAFYLYKTVLPLKLAPIYPLPEAGEFFNAWFFVSLLVLIAISVLCVLVAISSTRRVFLAAWLYYLITLAPVIGLVQVGVQAAADRYMYLPSLGPFMLIALGAGWLFKEEQMAKRLVRARAVVIALAVIISALMAYGTVRQSAVWVDSLTLWNREIELYPYRTPESYDNRGLAYYKDLGEAAPALEDYNTAIKLWPEYANAYASRGSIYASADGPFASTNNLTRALEDYNTAIKLNPTHAPFYYNRGLTRAKSRMIQPAIEDFDRAIMLLPDFKKAYYDRAIAYSILGLYAKTIKDLSAAIELDPFDAELYRNRGVAYTRLGEDTLAAKDYEMADKLK